MKIKQLIAVFIGATAIGTVTIYSTSKPVMAYADATASSNKNNDNNDDNDDNNNGQGDREPGVIGGNDQGGVIGGDVGAGGATSGGTTAGATATSGVGAGTTATNPQNNQLYGVNSSNGVNIGTVGNNNYQPMRPNNQRNGNVNGSFSDSKENSSSQIHISREDVRVGNFNDYDEQKSKESRRMSTFNGTSKNTKISITNANKKWYVLNKKIQDVSKGNLSDKEKQVQISNLMKQYNGAEATFVIKNANVAHGRKVKKPAKIKEKIIKGGLNDFVYSKSGLNALRTYYGKLSAESSAIGLLGGFPGKLFEKTLGKHFGEAQSDVKKMINKGRSRGGCRVTITDEFPIKSINSLKQARL